MLMSSAPQIQVSMAEPDIAVLTFDAPNKGANILSFAVLDEFEARLNELAAQAADRWPGLIIRSAKPGVFIAGADIREFAAATRMSPAQEIDRLRHPKVAESASRG